MQVKVCNFSLGFESVRRYACESIVGQAQLRQPHIESVRSDTREVAVGQVESLQCRIILESVRRDACEGNIVQSEIRQSGHPMKRAVRNTHNAEGVNSHHRISVHGVFQGRTESTCKTVIPTRARLGQFALRPPERASTTSLNLQSIR